MSRAAADLTNFALGEDAFHQLQSVSKGLNHDELLWASGYLAGQAAAATALPAPDNAADNPPLSVFYATETGNSRRVAEELVSAAASRGLRAQAYDVRQVKLKQLKKEKLIVFVAATHGLGDAPEGSEDFFEALNADRAPALDHLQYSVLSLGDSSYDDFCQVGVELDGRLAQLGARRFAPRVDCDLDFDDPAEKWRDAVLTFASKQAGDSATPTPHLRPVPKTDVSRTRPFRAPVLVNQRITATGSSKTVHHIELDLEGSGLDYEPGDALGVVTNNPARMVDAVLAATALDQEQNVTLGDDVVSLRDALTVQLDISASHRRFVEHYAKAAGRDDLATRLQELSGEAARAFFYSHQIVDVVREYPGPVDAQSLVNGLRKLTPRLYSIASSPLASPDEVHLTVAHVNYEQFGHTHVGSASTELLGASEHVDVYVQANPNFRLPEDGSAPVLMIGPGTGVAPFRAFVEHRAALGADGANWLFFGDREFRRDFLYQTEWQQHLESGALNRIDLAFSRDQAEKIYVQQRLLENARDVYDWLERGAHVYVCGDATRMAPDVHDALGQIVQRIGGKTPEQADDYLRGLQRASRYQKDVY
ncbi:MAG: sulfite reductase flavoprotein subunit alpha [Gammaproteobacteria bacterium]